VSVLISLHFFGFAVQEKKKKHNSNFSRNTKHKKTHGEKHTSSLLRIKFNQAYLIHFPFPHYNTPSQAENFSKERLADLQEGFELYDPERTGQLPIEHLPRVARACGANPTESEIITFLENFEEDFIDFTGFCEFISDHTHEVNEADLKKQFKVFDRAGTGKIVASELKHALKSIGDRLSEDEVSFFSLFAL
jgi:Ca2+-binding EF-hand superfamily protein